MAIVNTVSNDPALQGGSNAQSEKDEGSEQSQTSSTEEDSAKQIQIPDSAPKFDDYVITQMHVLILTSLFLSFSL